jgi:hypothetical protein
MVLGHILDWWILWNERLIINILFSILAPIAATGFLFVSGFSAAMAYKRRAKKTSMSTDTSMIQARNIYIIRAILLLAIGILYNIVIAFGTNNWSWIWAWNALQTISISALMAWPLLRTPKYLRIGLGIGLLVANDLLLTFLLPFEGQLNNYGVLFHFFYHPKEGFTILPYFAIFIIGTVVGDFFFDINSIEDQEKRRDAIKTVFLRTLLIVGIISTLFGITFRVDNFNNNFLHRPALSSMFYSIGAVLIMFAILLYIEEYNKLKTKKSYRFFFYYSFYSFTIYIAHDPLYFLFYQKINIQIIWFVAIGMFILITFLLKFLHKKVGPKASLKAQLSVLSLIISKKIEDRKSKK